MNIFEYKLEKQVAVALGATLDAALYWQIEFLGENEYESEYIESMQMMQCINRVRGEVFKVISGEVDELVLKDAKSIVCITNVLNFIEDWDNDTVDNPIDLAETLNGALMKVNEKQRSGIKELYKSLLKHIDSNAIDIEIFDFDTNTTLKDFYGVI